VYIKRSKSYKLECYNLCSARLRTISKLKRMTTTLSRANRADFLSHGVCEGWTVLYGLVTASTTQASSERDSTRQHGQVHNNG